MWLPISACCAFWAIGRAEFLVMAKWSLVSGCISSLGTSGSAQFSSPEECKHEDTPKDPVSAPVRLRTMSVLFHLLTMLEELKMQITEVCAKTGQDIFQKCRPRWPRGLKHELSSPTRTLGSWVRIPLKVYMFVYAFILCLCCPAYRW
jgi:hypothetical protein